MEHLRSKGGCGVHVSKHLKEKLAWAIDKGFHFISNLKTITPLRNKAALSLNDIICVAMWTSIIM